MLYTATGERRRNSMRTICTSCVAVNMYLVENSSMEFTATSGWFCISAACTWSVTMLLSQGFSDIMSIVHDSIWHRRQVTLTQHCHRLPVPAVD